jgi:ribulose-phosphate 3-epimerase
MNKPIKISPSLLSADFGSLTREALRAEKGGGFDIHLDIMDGHYVHNFSFGLDIISALKKHIGIPLVTHLEIDNPDIFLEDFADVGSDMIVVQEDTCPHLPLTIANITNRGVKAGIGINPDRGFEKLEANPEILTMIDLLIIMAVYPGFGGQPFSPVTVPKIREASSLRAEMKADFDIGVDGAVSIRTVPNIVSAGANYLIAGSSVFNRNEVSRNIKTLRDTAEKVRFNLKKDTV